MQLLLEKNACARDQEDAGGVAALAAREKACMMKQQRRRRESQKEGRANLPHLLSRFGEPTAVLPPSFSSLRSPHLDSESAASGFPSHFDSSSRVGSSRAA